MGSALNPIICCLLSPFSHLGSEFLVVRCKNEAEVLGFHRRIRHFCPSLRVGTVHMAPEWAELLQDSDGVYKPCKWSGWDDNWSHLGNGCYSWDAS